MAAHLQEAAIVAPVPADEDRFDRGLHVVVDAAPAGALEQGERPIMGVEHHLLRLTRIGPHEQHATVAEPDVSDLHGHRRSAQQDNLVAPIELIGFARSKAQRYKRCGGCLPAFLSPAPSIAAYGVVAAVISTARAVPRTAGSASDVRVMTWPRSAPAADQACLRQRPIFG